MGLQLHVLKVIGTQREQHMHTVNESSNASILCACHAPFPHFLPLRLPPSLPPSFPSSLPSSLPPSLLAHLSRSGVRRKEVPGIDRHVVQAFRRRFRLQDLHTPPGRLLFPFLFLLRRRRFGLPPPSRGPCGQISSVAAPAVEGTAANRQCGRKYVRGGGGG
jgi:hypothetical protein